MGKVKFYTFGCKSNQYDTQVLREDFLRKGYQESQNGLADIYVVNTCVVTQKAEEESKSLVRRLQCRYSDAEVIIAGCLRRYISKENRVQEETSEWDRQKITFFSGHTRAFLKIQDGCNNFCSYCIVPHVRGRSRSKPKDAVKEEFRKLLDNGYKEIVLTGICLGEYGKDLVSSVDLAGLLKELEDLEGEFRIRLSSLDPQYISADLIAVLASSKKICPHLHIPFQSGDDVILESMRRSYNVEFAFALLRRIREKIPDIVFTTDIIVGFPQEKESNFINTLKFLDFLSPAKVHIFSFSPRPLTPAAKLPYRVEFAECRRRYVILSNLQAKWRQNCLEKFIGKEISILVEKKISPDFFSGYSQYYLKADFPCESDCLHNFVKAKGAKIRGEGLLCAL
jgi:threonylcarbamoyladenosine tRNA methylthiotransferase MtaB